MEQPAPASPQMAFSLEEIKDVQRFAQANKGMPRRHKDSRTLSMRHLAGIQFAERQRTQTLPAGSLLKMTVGLPYLPCTTAVHELEKITMSQLRTETHHRGKVLTVCQGLGLVMARTSENAIVVHEMGETEILKLAHADASLGEDGLLPREAVMAIKEPYYTFNEEKAGIILVDHPSDIVVLDKSNPFVPAEFQALGLPENKTAIQWKEAGNEALGAKKYVKASDCYTRALLAMSLDGIGVKFDIHRNRAQVNLQLKRFDAAASDATAAIIGSEEAKLRDSKAYYRLGVAAYQLRDMARAKSSFNRMLELTPDDLDGKRMLARTTVRLCEQANGDYNFAAITAKISPSNARVDAADFTSKTEVKWSPGRGRGLFATANMKAGELVLCEKAFCAVFDNDEEYLLAAKFNARTDYLGVGSSSLWKAVVNNLHRTPSALPSITALSGIWEGLGQNIITSDSAKLVDTYQIHDIVVRNAYGCSTPSKQQAEVDFGFCQPSSGFGSGVCLGDLMVFRVTKPIAKGEEVTIAYTFVEDIDERRKGQDQIWGFQCQCMLCTAEGADSAVVMKERKRLAGAADAFIQRHPLEDGAPPPSSTLINAAEKLVKNIKDTYDANRYAGVPRNAALMIQYWIVQAYHDRREGSKCLTSEAEMFRLLAYKEVVMNAGEVVLQAGEGSRLIWEAVRAVIFAQTIMLVEGKRAIAAKLTEVARELYLTVNGVMDGFVELPQHVLR